MSASWTRQFTSAMVPVIWSGQVGETVYNDEPAKWFRATGAGTVTMRNQDGDSATYTVESGDVVTGEWSAILSTTCTRVLCGTGNVPPPSTLIGPSGPVGAQGVQGAAGATGAPGSPAAAIQLPDGAPIGFDDRTSSTISVSANTVSLAVLPPATQFVYRQGATAYTKTTTQSVSISTVVGPHYIYFVGETLTESTVDPGYYLPTVSETYWDGAKCLGLGDERHGFSMSPATHRYLHETVGTRYGQGLTLTQLSTGSAAIDTDAQVSITDGIIYDEDINISITRSAAPALAFQQELGLTTSVAGKFPIFYRTGSDGHWSSFTATNFPVRPFNGTAGQRIGYNLNTGGTWSIADPGANPRRVAVWIVATDSVTEPVIAVMGQRIDTSLSNAQANNSWDGMALGNLPFREIKVIYRIIYDTSTAFANTIKAYAEDVTDMRSVSNLPASSYVPTSHSSLSGLTSTNAHPDTAILVDPSGFSVVTSGDVNVHLAISAMDTRLGSIPAMPAVSGTYHLVVTSAGAASWVAS
jgi:hypothetical protein